MTTPRLVLPVIRSSLNRQQVGLGVLAAAQAAAVFALARHTGLWPVAIGLVVVMELWILRPASRAAEGERARWLLDRVAAVLMGAAVAMVIALSPRLVTQLGLATAYALWRVWWSSQHVGSPAGLVNLLMVQAVVFEALFLMAAVWRTPSWLVLLLLWGCAYVSVFAVLSRRGERAAGVMAATWALVATQISWVLLLWLFTYTVSGGYILVPQPALVLTALAYCFGSIYVSQRQGNLSRGRLTEYLLIGLILIAIVITGTPWRGSI